MNIHVSSKVLSVVNGLIAATVVCLLLAMAVSSSGCEDAKPSPNRPDVIQVDVVQPDATDAQSDPADVQSDTQP